MTINLEDINNYVYEHIPLTQALSAKIVAYDDEKVVISGALKPNINHRDTAFGGSLSAFGVLSGWALLFIKLKEEGITCRLVIQKSSFDFKNPIPDDFTTIAFAPSDKNWCRFIKTLTKYNKARIIIDSKVQSPKSGLGGTHQGVYVAVAIQKDRE
jgi:thioesterase domain-containing protein